MAFDGGVAELPVPGETSPPAVAGLSGTGEGLGESEGCSDDAAGDGEGTASAGEGCTAAGSGDGVASDGPSVGNPVRRQLLSQQTRAGSGLYICRRVGRQFIKTS